MFCLRSPIIFYPARCRYRVQYGDRKREWHFGGKWFSSAFSFTPADLHPLSVSVFIYLFIYFYTFWTCNPMTVKTTNLKVREEWSTVVLLEKSNEWRWGTATASPQTPKGVLRIIKVPEPQPANAASFLGPGPAVRSSGRTPRGLTTDSAFCPAVYFIFIFKNVLNHYYLKWPRVR